MGTTLFSVIRDATHTANEATIEKIAALILEQYGENVTAKQAARAAKRIMKTL